MDKRGSHKSAPVRSVDHCRARPGGLKSRASMSGTRDAISVVDLFCGAGGLSLGLRHAGFNVVHSVDHFDAAVSTYRHNLGRHIVDAEITGAMDLPSAQVIAGGPPCQGFSSAGARRTGDRRNTLVSVFASLIVRYRPLAFIFENVEGFLTAENGDYVLDLLEPVIEAGYRVHLRKINAANFGVPQHRKRVLGIGGLGWDPSFPEATHTAIGAPGSALAGTHLPLAPSLLAAIKGLPNPEHAPPGQPRGHFAIPLDSDDMVRVSALLQGQSMRDLPKHLWHDSYKRRAFRRVMDGTPTERRGGAPYGLRRLIGEHPSKAITSGARTEFVHPTADRYLTLRECARIQTFPDSFEFYGSQAEQTLLVGNAVPPMLAEVVGRQLRTDLREAADLGQSTGALLSFVPTLSSGMSPALQSVVDRVSRAFEKRGTPSTMPQMVMSWR